jgi:hypothetical protein
MKNMSNIQTPYEYQRGGISKETASNFNCRPMKYKRLLNGMESDVNEVYFFNEAHFKMVLDYWNAQGLRMARTPNPVDGKIYHWSYEPA